MTNSVYVTQSNFTVYGTSTNNTQTDQYALAGSNDTFINIGGNINITGIGNPVTATPTDTNTVIYLGNPYFAPMAISGVTDVFALDGGSNSLSNNGTVSGSTVDFSVRGTGGFNSVTLTGSNDTIDVETGVGVPTYLTALGGNSVTLVNTGGSNKVGLGGNSGPNTVVASGASNTITGYGTGNNVTLNGGASNWTYGGTNNVTLGASAILSASGANNTVNAGANSSVTLNGNATNNVTLPNGTVKIGFVDDGATYNASIFNSSVTLGAGATNLTGGDENFTIAQTGSNGGDGVTLGDGENNVSLTGANNTVQVGGGDNTIVAGTSATGTEIVNIKGIDNTNGAAYVADPLKPTVPPSPTDFVTITGTNDKVSATYENVVISGASANNATVGLGNGNNQVYLGGSGGHNTVTVGNGANSLNVAGNTNTIKFGDGSNNGITVSGSFNTLSETTTDGGGIDNIQLGAGLGDNVYLYNAGGSVTGTGVSGSYETTVTQLPTASAVLNVNLGNGAGDITLGNGNDKVTTNDVDGYGSTVTAGDGNDQVTANGDGAGITLGNGNSSVKANGSTDLISLGNGNSTVTATGGNDTFTFGSGSNHLNAGSIGGNTGTFGSLAAPAGNEYLTATGPFDSWTFYEAFNSTVNATLGGSDSLTQTGGSFNGSLTGDGDTILLNATNSLTTNISESGNGEKITFAQDAGGNVNLNPSSVSDILTVDGDANNTYAGNISISGLSTADTVDLQGVYDAGGNLLTNFAQVIHDLQPTLSGGEVLNLAGGGSITFASNAILSSPTQLSFSGLVGRG